MDDLNEKVLDIAQRQRRAQIMRRNKAKIERAREIAQKRRAPESNIRKRAFVQARQIIRRKVAGARGAEYEKLGPSEKMAIDRAVEGKQKLIKKLALRLIPRVKQAESKRLATFMKGHSLENQGQPEGRSKESSGSSSVNEAINSLFAEAFPPTDVSNALGQKVDAPVVSSDKRMPSKGKSKNTEIVQYNKFQEEVEYDTPAFASLFKKSEKSGIDLETLGEVYNRGWNAWPEDCKVTQEQFAFARVNSYINQGKTYFNEDADLHELSKDTLKSYASKAGPSIQSMSKNITDIDSAVKVGAKTNKRMAGMNKALSKIYREETLASRVRKKIEKVDRNPPHTEYAKQAEIKNKIIDEQGNCENDPKKRLMGTDSLVKAYKKDTPGQSKDINEAFNIAYAAGIGQTYTAEDLGMKIQGAFAYHPSVLQQIEDQEEVEEEVKTADKAPVVVPSHKDAYGNVIPAKTVLRKKNKVIVNKGDNPADGQ